MHLNNGGHAARYVVMLFCPYAILVLIAWAWAVDCPNNSNPKYGELFWLSKGIFLLVKQWQNVHSDLYNIMYICCVSRTDHIALWTFLVPKMAIKITVKIARISSSSCNFCYIWWFFQVLQHISYSPFWKIIKYCKKFGENKEKSFNYSIT